MQNDRWYRIKLHWKSTATNAFEAFVDGRRIHKGTPAGTTNRLAHVLFGIINACCGTFHIQNWIDGLVVGNTEASVEPPAAVYLDACGGVTESKVWQPRTAVSTTSITITHTKGSQGSGARCYYVVNQAGVTSSGFQITNP